MRLLPGKASELWETWQGTQGNRAWPTVRGFHPGPVLSLDCGKGERVPSLATRKDCPWCGPSPDPGSLQDTRVPGATSHRRSGRWGGESLPGRGPAHVWTWSCASEWMCGSWGQEDPVLMGRVLLSQSHPPQCPLWSEEKSSTVPPSPGTLASKLRSAGTGQGRVLELYTDPSA